MKKHFLAIATALGLAAGAGAQQAPKQPTPKSQKEIDAIMAVQSAQDPDARIQAAKSLIENFKDTEFKEWALQSQALAYQQKNDFENMLITGEQALEVNPDNVAILVMLAQAIPQRTKEFDLDKEEKLAKAEKFAKKAQVLIPNLAKFNPQITDEQWTDYKKNAMSQAHEALAMVAFVRKNYAGAEQSFKAAIDVSPQKDPTTYYRLALVYGAEGKYDQGIAALDEAIKNGGVKIGNRDLAADQKQSFEKAKAAAKPAAPAPAQNPPPKSEPPRP